MVPMYLKDGLAALLRETSVDQIGVVEVVSTSRFGMNGELWKPQYADLISPAIPRERVYPYIPPVSVGSVALVLPMIKSMADRMPTAALVAYHMLGDRRRREECIPHITDPSLVYVIADDLWESGSTMRRAHDMLRRQGVGEGSVWYFVGDILSVQSDQWNYLDRPSAFAGCSTTRSFPGL